LPSNCKTLSLKPSTIRKEGRGGGGRERKEKKKGRVWKVNSGKLGEWEKI
jgi:hypothetical protein